MKTRAYLRVSGPCCVLCPSSSVINELSSDPLYFEPEQGTRWQPELCYSYTQTDERSLGNSSRGGVPTEDLASWTFFWGKEVLKDKRREYLPPSSRFRDGSYSSECPPWRPRDGERQENQVELGKYPGQVSHPWLRWLRAAPPLGCLCALGGAQIQNSITLSKLIVILWS